MIYQKTDEALIKRIILHILKGKEDLPSIKKLKYFFNVISENKKSKEVLYLQYYLFYNFTRKEIRDRKVTARHFEDFISLIIGTTPTDKKAKTNPPISKDIEKLVKDIGYDVGTELSKNKREKSDAFVMEEGENISIKTLRGTLLDKDKGANLEINMGALCYQCLFYGLLTDEKYSVLGDRKQGLGSAPQLFSILLSEIFIKGKYNDFRNRFKIFLEYLYNDDYFFIAFKSDYQMQIYFFKGEEFVNMLVEVLDNSISEYEKIKDKINKKNISIAIEKYNKSISSMNKPKGNLVKLLQEIHDDTSAEYNTYMQSLLAFVHIFYRWELKSPRIHLDKLIDDSVWTSRNKRNITDQEYYFKENIRNPFRKRNLTVLDFQHLKNLNLLNEIDDINAEYLKDILQKLDLT